MKRFIYSLITLFFSFGVMAGHQDAPAISQREDIARQGVMDGYDFGPFKLLDMKAVVDSIIKKPKMTKPFHFSDAEMNALAPKNIADAIEIIRPPRSNSHGSVNLVYHIQTPPERTHMSPSFDIRYIGEMKEEGMFGIGWTVSKFILHKKKKDPKSYDIDYIWNGKKYSENSKDPNYSGCGSILTFGKDKDGNETISIVENKIKYTFLATSDPDCYLLVNSEYKYSEYKRDSIIYHYAKNGRVNRAYAKIECIDCKYHDDMIPHVKIKFTGDRLINNISIYMSKEKYEFTKDNAREASVDRYDKFCSYSFYTTSSEKDKYKSLVNWITQSYDGFSESFSHSFEYYNDTETIAQLDEMAKIYLDSLYTDNIDSVKSKIDSFRIDRTDLLKVVHTPLGACYTVNYGREIIKESPEETEENAENTENADEEAEEVKVKEDTVLVMNYLKINDGYREDGPLVLNRYSYSNGKVFEVEPIDKQSQNNDDDEKSIVVRFDTVRTYNMSDDDEVLQTMMRIYDHEFGTIYESESSKPVTEALFKNEVDDSEPELTKKFTYGCDNIGIEVSGTSNYSYSYTKNDGFISCEYGNLVQWVFILEDSVGFYVFDRNSFADNTWYFREELVFNDPDHKSATFNRYKNNDEFISYDLTYDDYGNMIKCVMPANDEKSKKTLTYLYEYDGRFNQYQTGVVDSRGFTSHMEEYDYRIGQPKTVRDMNGYVEKLGYRLQTVLDTVVSPIRLDMVEGGDKSKIYSAYSKYERQTLLVDRKTLGKDRSDTLVLKVDIPVKDSVKNAIFSDTVKKNLYSLLGQNVDLESCKLTFDKDSLFFADTVAFVECFCTDAISIPASVLLTRYFESSTDINKGGKNLTTSLFVDGLGRELYVNTKNSSGKNTFYDGSEYNEYAQKAYLIHPYENNPEDEDYIRYEDPKYDEYGRLTRVMSLDKYGNKVMQNFEYDAVGRVTHYSDNEKNVSYTYDLLGNLLEVKDEKTNTATSYSYDNAGNVISKTTPSGDVISYVYELDNLMNIKYPRIPSANITNIYGNKNSSYGRRNRVALSYNSSVVDEYFYNQQGRVAKVRRTMIVPNGKILTYVTEFKYDTWGRLLEMIYPDGEILTYSFNDAGLANGVSGRKTFDYKYIDKVEYDYLGRLTSVKFNNGITQKVTYDNNVPEYSFEGDVQPAESYVSLKSDVGEVIDGKNENSGIATVSNDGYLNAYFYDMSGNLAMNVGASNEKVYVNGKISGVNSLIEENHLFVNPYFEDQDSLCVKHILLNDKMVMTKVVDSFSYGAKPVRIERAGSNVEELGFVVNYDSLHALTANKAIQERVATVGDAFSIGYKPFNYPMLRNANVDDGEDNRENDVYVYGVDNEGNITNLIDKDKKIVLKLGEDNVLQRSENMRFIPYIRSNEYMMDISNGTMVPIIEQENELPQKKDAFGR